MEFISVGVVRYSKNRGLLSIPLMEFFTSETIYAWVEEFYGLSIPLMEFSSASSSTRSSASTWTFNSINGIRDYRGTREAEEHNELSIPLMEFGDRVRS